jgi:hypothetical protein
MFLPKHIFARRIPTGPRIGSWPRQIRGETKRKQNGAKTTLFPSDTRAIFPLEKNARFHFRKKHSSGATWRLLVIGA